MALRMQPKLRNSLGQLWTLHQTWIGSASKSATDFAAVQSTARKSYFQLFNLLQEYDIDRELLKKRFTDLQKVFHPDKFATGDQSSQESAADLSSLINQAFKTLQDPHERGLYLLQLLGFELKDDGRNADLSPEFLAEMLELNEDVEDAGVDRLKNMLDQNSRRQQEIQHQLAVSFRDKNFARCHKLLDRLKFYRSLESSIKQRMP